MPGLERAHGHDGLVVMHGAAVHQRDRQVAGEHQQPADILDARIVLSRLDRRPGRVDPRPLAGGLDAGELAEFGDQPDIAKILVEHRAGEVAQILRRFRACDIFGGRHRNGFDGVFRRRDIGADAAVRKVVPELDDRAGQQHVQPREVGGVGRSHQRFDLGDMVEARRQAVDARYLEFVKQRLRLRLGAGVAHPDRLEVADLVDLADGRQHRVGGLGTRVGLAGLEQRAQGFGDDGVVLGGAEGKAVAKRTASASRKRTKGVREPVIMSAVGMDRPKSGGYDRLGIFERQGNRVGISHVRQNRDIGISRSGVEPKNAV